MTDLDKTSPEYTGNLYRFWHILSDMHSLLRSYIALQQTLKTILHTKKFNTKSRTVLVLCWIFSKNKISQFFWFIVREIFFNAFGGVGEGNVDIKILKLT